MKAIEALRRAMKKEDELLGFSEDVAPPTMETPLDTPVKSISDVGIISDDEILSRTVLKSHASNSTSAVKDPYHTEGLRQEEAFEEDDGIDEQVLGVAEWQDHLPETTGDSGTQLERELDKLLLGAGRRKKGRDQPPHDVKPNVGAAKAKRLKRAEKLAALAPENAPSNRPRKKDDPNPAAVMQKARGETTTTGKKPAKKR
jgi:hypothetical protein